jgi:hypothetical protein
MSGGDPTWEDPAWLAEAHAWIREHVDVTGEIERPHVRAWSTALRVPTAHGPVWFKASAPALAHDGPVTAALARIRPDAVLTPLAVDVRRGFVLLPEGGETLRMVRERGAPPAALDRGADSLCRAADRRGPARRGAGRRRPA